jgi:hypothetical protein
MTETEQMILTRLAVIEAKLGIVPATDVPTTPGDRGPQDRAFMVPRRIRDLDEERRGRDGAARARATSNSLQKANDANREFWRTQPGA